MKKTIILLLVSILTTSFISAQCLASLKEESLMLTNPENEINSVFYFDYKINSNLEYENDGVVKRYNMTYYVNTADGSMFFPKGLLSANGFNTADDNLRFDGTVWLSNRQMVVYILEIPHNKKRAMTVTTHKTSTDTFMDQHLAMLTFFNDMVDPEMTPDTPEPLPESFIWDGITQGYAGKIVGADSEAYMTIYFDKRPTNIITTAPKVGFLAGVIKDHRIEKCNRLAVFTKIKTEGDDYIQEELISITKEKYMFDGTAYKPAGLLKEIMSGPGSGMQNMKANMAEFQSKAIALGQQLQKLQKEKRKCIETARGDNSYCNEKYDSLIKENKQQSKQLQYEMMKKMGAEDMMKH